MAILGFFLKSLFLVGIFVGLFLIGIVIYLYMRVKHIAHSFHQAAGAGMSGAANADAHRNTSAGSTSKRRSDTYDDGVVVEEELYDNRSRSEANRKIFAKDEGEYVDYEEEK